MATTTTNLKLTKPAVSDAADITVLNANFDKIDEKCNPALFAPSGYGLGEATRNIGDWNTELKNGWYFAKNNAPDNNYWHGFIATHPDGSMVQTVYRGITAGAVLEAKRTYDTDTGVFGEWEWENPPMQLGVEYRTTERWNGSPVYTKLVDCGNAVNGAEITVTVTPANPVPIRFAGKIAGHMLPYLPNEPTSGAHGSISAASKSATEMMIRIHCGANLAGRPTTVQLWYY